ncbi:YhcH/YjgK/YiaL family protein [Cetobacterium sp. 8H]|uniref:YhcH/YjgK/YiaL family protein n=1 Tax=Cetobacterium sp. 8H TaxID=2759681 RepID=UPI00163D1709|nr:YhcH/YjgK/YiaL family protein [Cetobacterium sp. 8H]MBC2851969.1 YhcH/YjgK/YiaL family protein [Cetobacterium sp. 8H]
MIFGKIDELKFYKGVSKGLDKAIETIENGSYKTGVIGRNEIDGDNVFFNLQECKTKVLDECFFEGHKNYIDIHVVIDGEEGIGYSLRDSLKEKTEYNSESDFQVLEGVEEHRFQMDKENFIIFFPDEPHMPLIASNEEPQDLRKVVFKIKY